MKQCQICQEKTKNKCSNCNQIFYCSVEHQKQDWKTHRCDCRPFKVEQNEELGRHLIATRNIKPFEIVLKEEPLICGPSQITSPVCLECLGGIDPNDLVYCDKCGWPLCSDKCKGGSRHKAECDLTVGRGRKVNIQEFTNPHPLYQCITTIRCLLLSKTCPDKWEKLKNLESFENQRRGSMQWKADLECIGKFIPRFFQTNEFKEEEILKIVGILQINGHEVPSTDPAHVAIFYYASLLEHSCIANLAKSFTKDGHVILWAPKLIKKDSHLSICYTDAIWGTAERQSHLMHTKLFKCNCNRCTDVTEFDTYYNALKCSESNCKAFLLPRTLKEWNQKWRCNSCNNQIDKISVDEILERAEKDSHAMEVTVDNCIRYIQHYQKWLPEQHFRICNIKMKLVEQIAPNLEDLMRVSDEQLNLKGEYARSLLNLYEILVPSEVRLLGILSFELHSVIAEVMRRRSSKDTSTNNFLRESLYYCEKSINYFQYESECFIEGRILKQAKINRDTIKKAMGE